METERDSSKSWFSFVAAMGHDDPEILIYDFIGAYGVTAKDFDTELKALGVVSRLTLRINSPGGETPTAASIYNMMSRYKEKNKTHITVYVDGIAASSGSWLAMLGDTVIMPDNALMMIHDPSGGAYGTSAEMRRLAGALDKVKQGMVTAYAAKSGKSREDVEAIMTAETWYDADEAVEAGFADEVEGHLDHPVAVADLSMFRNPPVALTGGAHTEAHLSDSKEVPVTTPKDNAETPAQVEARIRAAVESEFNAKQALKTTVVTEPVAETTQQVEARIRAEYQLKEDITAACADKGVPDKAAEYIKAGKTLSEVNAALRALPAPKANGRQSTTAQLNAHSQSPLGQDSGAELQPVKLDPAAIWAKWNGTPKKR